MPGLRTHVTSRWEKIRGSNSKSLLRACQKERFRCADAQQRKRKRRLQHMEEQHSLYEEWHQRDPVLWAIYCDLLPQALSPWYCPMHERTHRKHLWVRVLLSTNRPSFPILQWNFFPDFWENSCSSSTHLKAAEHKGPRTQCTSGFVVKNLAAPGVWLELGLDEAFDLLGGQSISDSKGTRRRRGHRHDRRCNLCSHIPAILEFFALSLSFLCCCSSLPFFLLFLLLLLLLLLSTPTLLPPSAYYFYFLPFSSSRGCNSCKWQRRRSIPAAAAAAGGLYQSDAP